jgi:glyoxylase-like metal-dependent hydrolase (beta-lactamase superfamily II)
LVEQIDNKKFRFIFSTESSFNLQSKSLEFEKMLRKMAVGPYQANCYIMGCDKTSEGLVIDPGDQALRIVEEISRNRLKIRQILITHGHIDHIVAAKELRDITKAPVLIHSLDAPALNFPPDGYLQDGQKIEVGHYSISAIHTPGHSPGGMCFYAPGAVFTGDTLFAGSIGRTDFTGGNHQQLIEGVVKKIFPLGDHIRVYPGHGPATTIGRERLTNPFFRMSQAH